MCIMFGVFLYFVFFFKQKTAYEMLISDWSSDVCSSDLARQRLDREAGHGFQVRLAFRSTVAVVLVLHMARLEQAEHGGFPARRLELAGVVDERAVGIEGLPFGNQVAAVLALAADAGHHLFIGQELEIGRGQV